MTSLVTIGLPCFNAADTIRRAIDSALAQDWPEIEVIVVDDRSTDGSADIVAAHIADEPRARLVRHAANTGPAGSRNTVVAEAKGEFVAFFDDDDEALTSRVRRQIEVLTEHERRSGAALVACYAGGSRRYPNGYVKPLPAIGVGGNEPPHGPGVADWLLFYGRTPGWSFGSGVPSCALLARRSTFEAVGGFDAGLRRVEDVDFAVRLALGGGHFVGTPEPLFVQHATDAVDKSPERNLEAELRLAEKYRDYLRSVHRYTYARRWPRLRYWHFKRRYGRFLAELVLLALRYPIAVPRHLLATGPRRLAHERSMRAGGSA